jgi:hypothetical protein
MHKTRAFNEVVTLAQYVPQPSHALSLSRVPENVLLSTCISLEVVGALPRVTNIVH